MFKRKASMIACLFFSPLFFFTPVFAQQQWQFDKTTLKAYHHLLNLHTTEALALVANPRTAQDHYVASITQATELLITEDPKQYSNYEDQFEKRLRRKTKTSSPTELFLQAETHLHWSFVCMKFGHDFDAALNLRQAYFIAKDCKKEFPEFIAIKKTIGLVYIVLGAIPEKYNWVLDILGMEGSFESGLKQLGSADLVNSELGFEAKLLIALIQAFVLQNPDVGIQEINSVLTLYPTNRLALFTGAALRIKNSQSEEALKLLSTLSVSNQGLPLHFANYLLGEVYLQKGDYSNAITCYRKFRNNYGGQNYLKDTMYKIGICYFLNGNVNDARVAFRLAKDTGSEITEADKYAARHLGENELPNIKLTKTRYATDGGYYEEAAKLLQSITPKDLVTKCDQVEYYYRKARLADKLKQLAPAKLFYKQTIDMNGNEPWYFAPNSCLQLGYLALDEKDLISAKSYFQMALSYKKHEYKNSIDSKAKSALAQLTKRK